MDLTNMRAEGGRCAGRGIGQEDRRFWCRRSSAHPKGSVSTMPLYRQGCGPNVDDTDAKPNEAASRNHTWPGPPHAPCASSELKPQLARHHSGFAEHQCHDLPIGRRRAERLIRTHHHHRRRRNMDGRNCGNPAATTNDQPFPSFVSSATIPPGDDADTPVSRHDPSDVFEVTLRGVGAPRASRDDFSVRRVPNLFLSQLDPN